MFYIHFLRHRLANKTSCKHWYDRHTRWNLIFRIVVRRQEDKLLMLENNIINYYLISKYNRQIGKDFNLNLIKI